MTSIAKEVETIWQANLGYVLDKMGYQDFGRRSFDWTAPVVSHFATPPSLIPKKHSARG